MLCSPGREVKNRVLVAVEMVALVRKAFERSLIASSAMLCAPDAMNY